MHTLGKNISNFNSIDAADQKVGSLREFQPILQISVARSKAHYFLMIPKAPHESVVHKVMLSLIAAVIE